MSKVLIVRKETKEKRRCLNCGADISHRPTQAKYCSDECRKASYGSYQGFTVNTKRWS